LGHYPWLCFQRSHQESFDLYRLVPIFRSFW
jgi:hypothetical protein